MTKYFLKAPHLIFAAIVILASSAAGQKNTSWTEIARKDAEKTLSESPWAKTQIDTDTSEMFFSPTKPGTSSIGQSSASRAPAAGQTAINNNRSDQGATNQAVSVNYHIRFLSARPVREAISRIAMLESTSQPADFVELMQPFVDRDFGPFVVLTVNFDSTDGRFSGPVLQAFSSATADTLKNKTYLERKDGKRIYLMDYRAPQNDPLGAKFVFQRASEAGPFLNENSGSVRFYSEVGAKIKLNVTFRISELIYNGKLEY